eukprot:scaffold3821_cov173-Amphora_coffeaeformis.AAC.16
MGKRNALRIHVCNEVETWKNIGGKEFVGLGAWAGSEKLQRITALQPNVVETDEGPIRVGRSDYHDAIDPLTPTTPSRFGLRNLATNNAPFNQNFSARFVVESSGEWELTLRLMDSLSFKE